MVSNGRKENVKFVNGYVSVMERGFIICHLGIPVWLSNENLLKMETDYAILIPFFYSKKKWLFQLLPLHPRQKKKNQQNKNQQYNPPENYHWASKHIEMYGSKWQRRRSSLWFLLWCDVSCKEVHENETGQHSGIPLFSEVQGETESRKRQSAYLFGMWSKVKFKNTALLAKVKPKIKLTPQIWSICCQS